MEEYFILLSPKTDFLPVQSAVEKGPSTASSSSSSSLLRISLSFVKIWRQQVATSVLLNSWCSWGSHTASLVLRSAIQTLVTGFGLCLISFSLCLPATDMHTVIQDLWASRKKSEFSSRRMVELLSNDCSTRLSLALIQYSPRTSSWGYNSSTWLGVSA